METPNPTSCAAPRLERLTEHDNGACVPPAGRSAVPAGMRSSWLGYDPALDGIRALSITLVVGVHSPLRDSFPFKQGWLGVDIFFVLSGYLITALLLRERERTGGVNLGKFYSRRLLRLTPGLWAWLLVLAVFGLETWAALFFGAFYVSNLAILLGFMSLSGPTTLTWSLAVEEQFYLCWSPLVKWVEPRRLLRLALWLIVAIMCWRVILMRWGVNGFPYLYVRPDARFDTIFWGCVAALVEQRPGFARLRQLIRANQGVLLSLLFLVGLLSYRLSESWGLYTGHLGFTVNAVVIAGLILWLRSCPDSAFARLMGLAPLTWLGRLSYSIYLWHLTVVSFLFHPLADRALTAWPALQSPAVPHAVLLGLGIMLWGALVLAPAVLSYYLVERPLLLVKDRWFRASKEPAPRQQEREEAASPGARYVVAGSEPSGGLSP